MKRVLISLLALALCAAAFPLLFAGAQDAPQTRRRPFARPEKSLDQLVRRHERLKLNPAVAARKVRAGGGLSIATPEHQFELDLTPNDLRAPGYRAEATDEYGVRRPLVESGPVRTYKGSVRGQAKAVARFTVDDETVEGMILTPEERYYVEPLSKYEPEAEATDFILYKRSDVIEGADQMCGTMDGEVGEAMKGVISQFAATTEPSAVVGIMYEAEIATEADYAYYQKLGTADAANAEIMSTMNQVDGVYEAELNISLKVVYQHVWTGTPTSTYPYGTSVGDKLLEKFTNYWNANFTSVHRDLAHLWTGQNIVDPFNDPNLIGIANPGTVCGNPPFAYSLSERMTTAANRAILAAHEIGHNFGATHQCEGTIMNSFLSGTTLTFCPSSRTQIAAFLDINSSCLTQSCSPAISPAALSFPAAGGTGSVSVATTASCSWAAKSNVPWIVVNSGASGSGNKTVGYTVAVNPDPLTRTGTLTIAGKTHTVTQGPATVLSRLALNLTTVPGGKKV
ncbi:MAG TPA: M12 family metallo-peptidase, partial [Pyrinomonadaceae bacterium]|nr:M12 family metallo-peptidase [Pyrinomonadaceae bacterium]